MDEPTRKKIEKVVWQTLREAGIVRPPVATDVLLEHLRLYREYYNLQDPSFFDRAKHRIHVLGRKLVGPKLIEILRKVRLRAVLFGDEGRIVVDSTLPEIKREWPSVHETVHRILPWHRPFFFGDTAQTLDPYYQESLEEEANYGATALMLCGPVFLAEAADTEPGWPAIERLKKDYRQSYPLILRRYVQCGPHRPMAYLVSTPSWQGIPADQTDRNRHFVVSPLFSERFPGITAHHFRQQVDAHAVRRRGGLVADFTFRLNDDCGLAHEFHAESFFNTHYLQTLFVDVGVLSVKHMVLGHA